ncbi:MAG TPA: NPCBM/NEW2 domain-containing protein [Armatimonadota bacterium]|jgi:alpha-galactosidase
MRLSLPILACVLLSAPLRAETIWVEDLGAANMSSGYSVARVGQSIEKKPLTLGGVVYQHGLGVYAPSEMHIRLNGSARRFTALVGIDSARKSGSVVFEVRLDGRSVLRTRVLRAGDAPQRIDVDLRGAKRLWLRVDDADDGASGDVANWADAAIEQKPGGDRPTAFNPGAGPAMPIARARNDELGLHGPRVTGASPGKPFLFRIAATGRRPIAFAAKGLPDGLSLNASTGIITGALKTSGRWTVALTARNAQGAARRDLVIVGGPRALAQTPPIGWSAWNVWAGTVDDAKVRAAADAMVRSGLADHGFQFVNIDDCWQAKRDDAGRIQPKPGFPDMKALADFVHSHGLKLGIYSSPGPETCGNAIGSYQHEEQDARTFADWGIDYLKYDHCYYSRIQKDYSTPELKKPYAVMGAAIAGLDRDITYSLCEYGMGKVWQWGPEVGAQLWRTTGDILDNWGNMRGIGFQQNGLAPYAGPGHWNDADMLVVGQVGWGGPLRNTGLTPNEQITHITLWSLCAAPLMLGCDLSRLDPFTIDLMSNDEVLDVDQDPLGRAASRVARIGDTQVWARPLFDGSTAVGLFNLGPEPTTVSIDWKSLRLPPNRRVRDLWQRKDLGTFKAGYAALVPAHGAELIVVR